MQFIEKAAGSIYAAEAPLWETGHPSQMGRDHLLVGVPKTTLTQKADRGLSVNIGQMFGILCRGMIHCEYLFKGLRREMIVADDPDAANHKLAASWRQEKDAFLSGGPRNSQIEYRDAPKDRVFVVYISLNRMIEQYPEIYGWAEHWTWVASDPHLTGAPVDWETRFDSKFWSSAP